MRKRIKWQTPELVLCGGIIGKGTLPYKHDGVVLDMPYQADWMTNPRIEFKHEVDKECVYKIIMAGGTEMYLFDTKMFDTKMLGYAKE